jgi:acetolactate synthase-1/2/3 large subunit
MPLSERTTAVEALLDLLQAAGVTHIFGVPGAAITAVHETLARRPHLQHVLAKHEGGAAFMAAAHARVRRGLGVCLTTTGPGATNALTGVACARADSTPVIVLTGQSALASFGKNALQESTGLGVDVVRIFESVTKMSVMVPSAERMPELVQRAIRTALSGRPGPVHLSLPADILRDEVVWERGAFPSLEPARTLDREAVAQAARFLSLAQRPCILAGHGVEVSGAWAELLELATFAGIPVATTPKAKGVFPENHPLSLGVFGFGGHPRAETFLLRNQVDLLLVVGSSLGELATHAWAKNLRPSLGVIQVDVDPTQIGLNYPVKAAIVGDARAVLRELIDVVALESTGAHLEDPLATIRGEIPPRIDYHWREAPPVPMKPQRLVEELRRALPDDAILLVDNGNAILWAGHYFEVRRPMTYVSSLGLASMAHAVAGVVGAKLAAPERPVVALVGDAAFAMNGMEVHTAVEHGVAAIWVVLNDGGHGMVRHGETMALGHHLGACRFRTPLDVAAMANAIGARGFTVRTPAEARDALEEALAAQDRPSVIDARIDPDEVPVLLARRALAVARSLKTMPPPAPAEWSVWATAAVASEGEDEEVR